MSDKKRFEMNTLLPVTFKFCITNQVLKSTSYPILGELVSKHLTQVIYVNLQLVIVMVACFEKIIKSLFTPPVIIKVKLHR